MDFDRITAEREFQRALSLSAFHLAFVHIGLGDHDRAMRNCLLDCAPGGFGNNWIVSPTTTVRVLGERAWTFFPSRTPPSAKAGRRKG